MPLTDMLAQQGIMPGLRPVNKKALLEAISEQAEIVSGLPARLVFDALLQRERLGSTGIGGGIAIPHGKFEGLRGSWPLRAPRKAGRFRFARR